MPKKHNGSERLEETCKYTKTSQPSGCTKLAVPDGLLHTAIREGSTGNHLGKVMKIQVMQVTG